MTVAESSVNVGGRGLRERVPLWVWLLVCGWAVAMMGYLRLVVYPQEFVPLTNALVLLICLLHRDLRILWGMAGVLVVLLFVKLAMIDRTHQYVFGMMQLVNTVVPAAVIHAVIRLTDRLEVAVRRLEQTNAELEASNEELAAREEEMAQQNEELQSQAAELEQQSEELHSQSEELQTVNEQLAAQERTLGELLEATAGGAGEFEALAKLGDVIERLMGSRVCAAAVMEPVGSEMLVRPLTGLGSAEQRLQRTRTLAELVLTRDRAGFLADVQLRPDLEVPGLCVRGEIRSVAAAPLRVGENVVGALEIYSLDPGDWSEQDLRVLQWMADQCGRMWTTAKLREELQEQRRILQTVTDTSAIGLFLLDHRGRCTYLNPAAERLTGYGAAEVLNRTLEPMLLGSSKPAMFAEGRGGGGEDEIVCKDGRRRPVVWTSSAARVDGRVLAVVVEMQDATAQRRFREEREQLLEAERAARAEAERANHAKDEFVATLSHELRTPLNAVLGWAALLRKSGGSDGAEVAKAIEVIERNARLQSQLISDLLDISRITAGKVRLDVQVVDLPLVIESALESVRPAAEAKGVRLERQIEPMDRIVMGDPGRLQQVVWNLLSNGIKFTPREGHVKIAVSRPGSHVHITVSDDGEGVDPAVLPRLFDRYRQASDGASRRHSGLGLGLAIVKHLVELHGGSVHARSEGPGKGASFTVLLPVRAAAPAEAGGLGMGEREAAAPMLKGVTALVVDDESDALELVRRILTDRGARVVTASSGAEALDRLAKSRPGVLISDIGMPGMDGYGLIRAVRERWPESMREMPAIALTAFARPDDRSRALVAGFQAHLAKPVEAAELVSTVAQLRQSLPA